MEELSEEQQETNKLGAKIGAFLEAEQAPTNRALNAMLALMVGASRANGITCEEFTAAATKLFEAPMDQLVAKEEEPDAVQ